MMSLVLQGTTNWIQQGMLPHGFENYSSELESYLIQKSKQTQHQQEIQSQDRRIEVQKLEDIKIFWYRLKDDAHLPEEFMQEDVRDEELRRKIEQYNRINKNNKERQSQERRSRRSIEGRQQGRKRKVRTTITQSKLDEMNRIFSQYLEQRQRNKSKQSEQDRNEMQANSLKQIGERLGLGYSTILHKFRQFRATKKVKGGALIAALQQKRKYKKSKDIQLLISKSLKEKNFYTAVELSKHIEAKYKKTLSRSIISRHLGQMGYSYKNVKSKSSKNSHQIKSLRRTYSLCLNVQRNKYKRELLFIDQLIILSAEFTKKPFPQRQSQNYEIIYMIVLTTLNEVVSFKIKFEAFSQLEFEEFLMHALKRVKKQYEDEKFLLILDMENKAHYSNKVLSLRQQEDLVLFYIPPASNELNIIESISNKLKDHLKKNQYENVQEMKQAIFAFLQYPEPQLLQNCAKEVLEYVNKGLQESNF